MRSPAPLSITVEPLEEARLIRAVGEIDISSVDAIRSELECARQEAATVLLDLSDVTFIDSSGLHLLLDASRSAAVDDWPFFIVRASAAVQRLIEVSGTADLLALVEPPRERVLGDAMSGASDPGRGGRTRARDVAPLAALNGPLARLAGSISEDARGLR